jgi:hypothetical protein
MTTVQTLNCMHWGVSWHDRWGEWRQLMEATQADEGGGPGRPLATSEDDFYAVPWVHAVAQLEQIRGVHLSCGCIKLSWWCIYGENLTIITIFANFGGALAPTARSVAWPLGPWWRRRWWRATKVVYDHGCAGETWRRQMREAPAGGTGVVGV